MKIDTVTQIEILGKRIKLLEGDIECKVADLAQMCKEVFGEGQEGERFPFESEFPEKISAYRHECYLDPSSRMPPQSIHGGHTKIPRIQQAEAIYQTYRMLLEAEQTLCSYEQLYETYLKASSVVEVSDSDREEILKIARSKVKGANDSSRILKLIEILESGNKSLHAGAYSELKQLV